MFREANPSYMDSKECFEAPPSGAHGLFTQEDFGLDPGLVLRGELLRFLLCRSNDCVYDRLFACLYILFILTDWLVKSDMM